MTYNPYNNNYYNQYQQRPQMNQYAFVNGIEGAKAFQLQPNQTILLMDCDKQVAYMKTSDNVGKSTLRYFNLVEISEEDLIKQFQPKPSVEYVTKADFEALNNKFNDLLSALQNPKKEEINNA